jgi:predicted ATPase
MSAEAPVRRLSGDEIAALTFAARRQLTRWANRRELQPREQTQRATLIRAVRVLEDPAIADGCELQRPTGEK